MPPKVISGPRALSDEGRALVVRAKSPDISNRTAAATAISVDKPLTTRQKAFAKAWAAGENPPSAMHSAGYSVVDTSLAYRMMRMPNVIAAYKAEQVLYAEASQITRKKVVDMLLESYEVAKTMSEPSAMVAAAREVGKVCGHYEPQRVNINVSGTVAVETQRMNSMTDAELLELIAKGQNPITALEAPDAGEEDDEEVDA